MSSFSTFAWGAAIAGGGLYQAPLEVPAPSSNEKAVSEGAKTRTQTFVSPSNSMFMPSLGCDGPIGAFPRDSNGLNAGLAARLTTQKLASTYANIRRMRADGIVAIGREMADALIVTNTWSYELRDDDVDEKVRDRVRDMWEGKGGRGTSHQGLSLRSFMQHESRRAKDFGNHSLEIVFGEDEEGFTVVTELPPLLPDTTRPLVYQGTRQFAGVRNWGIGGTPVDLDPMYCVRMIHDSEGGDLFGRSRFDNCKDWIQQKWDLRDKIKTDMNTAIGNILSVGYPVDPDPTVMSSNLGKAGTIGISLAAGMTVSVPNFSLNDQMTMVRNNIDPSKLSMYPINRINTGTNSFDGFKVAIDLDDEQILFGLLVLPRSVKEAAHGARADAEQHTDSMAMMAWPWILYVAGLAQTITDDVLEQWGGKELRGAVRIVPSPLDDQTISILQAILTTMLTSNAELGMKSIDLKALFDKLEVKTLPDFDQQKLILQAAAKSAGDELSSAEKLRTAGYDEAGIKRIQNEKKTQDAVPVDPDGLGNQPGARAA